MYAVIRTGGKQLKVSEGDIVEVESQSLSSGDSITFSDVLLLADGRELKLGTPRVDKANVFGTVLDVFRSTKIIVFKKKRRKQYRRTRGHRQSLMRVRIDEIGFYEQRQNKLAEGVPEVAPVRQPKRAVRAPAKKAPAAAKTSRAAAPRTKQKAQGRTPAKGVQQKKAAKPKTSKAPESSRKSGKKR